MSSVDERSSLYLNELIISDKSEFEGVGFENGILAKPLYLAIMFSLESLAARHANEDDLSSTIGFVSVVMFLFIIVFAWQLSKQAIKLIADLLLPWTVTSLHTLSSHLQRLIDELRNLKNTKQLHALAAHDLDCKETSSFKVSLMQVVRSVASGNQEFFK
jgi:hypothetical protein